LRRVANVSRFRKEGHRDLKKSLLVARSILSLAAAIGLTLACTVQAASVTIQDSARTSQSAYAKRRLASTLAERGHSVTDLPAATGRLIDLRITPESLGPDAFAIRATDKVVVISGGDARGLVYGALEAREQLLNGVELDELSARTSTPKLAFRGIKLNTPWDSYRPSSALDQHHATARDLKFWEDYLDMMVENRFTAFTLWTMHPFTYMIRPRNFPEASKWSDAEFAEWQKLYREIFRMAKERGLDTYVVFWSIFVSQEFARAHGVAKKNFYPHYYVDGDTSPITKRYLRESVAQMLLEYPDLDGIGVSHGEGMAGMTPLQRQQFVDEVYIAGALEARRTRPVKLIHRVPFSSGLDSGPGVSAHVEQVTRAAMEKLGNSFSGPIWVEMKFNWSHGHSTPKLIKVHGGKLGDTYFKPPPSNYKVVWQVRNEDFFALRWGDAGFIREHIGLNGTADHVGGYFVGSETYIPALDYFTAAEPRVDWKWAFQRQWLFYKLWGRLLYDPKTPDSVFSAEFTRRYGRSGERLLRAYSFASQTPLTLARIYDSRWDFTLYSEGMLALQGEITRYIGIDALIDAATLDPDHMAIAEFVSRRQTKKSIPRSAMTPLETAEQLEEWCREALDLVKDIETARNASLMYEVADVTAWAQLGLHLAEKLRGAVALQTYRVAGGEQHKRAAVEHLTKALGHWDALILITSPIYKDMRLTHYNHNSFDANPNNLFHWALIRDQVAKDVEVARSAKAP
jgi:hypothetical protein